MKKINVKMLILIVGMMLILVGCDENESKQKTETVVEQTDTQDKDTKEEIKEEKEEVKEEEKTESIQEMVIHYIDMDTAERKQEEIEMNNVTAEDIWRELQKKELLTAECQLNSFSINKEDNSIAIDVNAGFGNYIRSMGTAGESEIIFCVANSFLDTYECEKLKITEEGNLLETGHTVFDDYITKNS